MHKYYLDFFSGLERLYALYIYIHMICLPMFTFIFMAGQHTPLTYPPQK